VGGGCVPRGRARVPVEFEGGGCPSGSDWVNVFLLPDVRCDACRCAGGCDCNPTSCTPACTGCDLSKLAQGIAIQPPRPGPYAVVFEFTPHGGGPVTALACANVTVDNDGTEDKSVVASGMCCP